MRRRVSAGELEPQEFRMPFAPWSNYLTLAFLVLVVVLLGFSDDIAGKVTLASIPVLVVGLWLGWRAVSKRAARRPAPVTGDAEG
jgi:L-asparagine permease